MIALCGACPHFRQRTDMAGWGECCKVARAHRLLVMSTQVACVPMLLGEST